MFETESDTVHFQYGIFWGLLIVLFIWIVVRSIKILNKALCPLCPVIHDEKSSSVLMDEIKIGDRKKSVDDRTSEFLLQEIKEKLQSLDEILRPKETRISIPPTIATFPE